MKKTKNILIPLFLAGMLSLPLLAEETDETYVLADFSHGSDGFKSGSNVMSVDSMTTSDGQRECLEVVTENADIDLIRTISAELGSFNSSIDGVYDGCDLTEYQSVSYEIYASEYEADPEAEYFTRVVLYSLDGTSSENIISISPMTWSKVKLEIGNWQGRSQVSSIEISLLVSTDVQGTVKNDFYIDEILAENKIDREHTKRYMIDDFDCIGGSAEYDDENSALVISLDENEDTLLSAAVFPEIPNWETNALRLRIENDSDIDSLTIFYSSSDNPSGVYEDKSTLIRLERRSQLKSYYVDVGDISKLRSIRFQLGKGEGKISISSICAISQYIAPKYQTCGNITGCTFTDDLLYIRFTGDIGREEALSNQSGMLKIYAVDPGINIENIDFASLTPIAESPMTTKFDLMVDRMSDERMYMKEFIACSVRTDGTYVLIDAPFYLENIERAAKYSAVGASGKKGVNATDISMVSELRADVTMLTVDASKAFTSRTKGENYIFSGMTFYIDREYFEPIKAQIEALRGVGVGVYLRITDWSEALGAELLYNYLNDGYSAYADYYAIPTQNDFLTALGAYIGENFCADGSVVGIILGECENFIGLSDGKYNSLNDMASGFALSLRNLHAGLAVFNSQTELYFSVSNLLSNELAASTSEVGAYELVPALCSEIDMHGGFEWGLCIEDFYRLIDYDDTVFSASACSELIALLRSSGVYDTRLIFCDSNYIFFDMATAEKISRAAKSYYSACFNSHIDAVFCTISGKSSDSRFGEMIELIDSENSLEISEMVLDYLGINDWNEVVDGFDPERLTKKTFLSVDAKYELPKGIKGRYEYFTFDSFSGTCGIEPGFYCRSLKVTGGENGILRAELDPSFYNNGNSADLMGISYRFEYPENMKLTPILEITLGVDMTDSVSEFVEVKVVLNSGDDRYEANALLNAGEMTTIYVDISDFDGIRDVESIQIFVMKDSGKAVLSLEKMIGLSKDYNDESLESVIADERAKKRTPDIEDGYRNYFWIGGGVIIACATVLTVMLLSRRKDEGESGE